VVGFDDALVQCLFEGVGWRATSPGATQKHTQKGATMTEHSPAHNLPQPQPPSPTPQAVPLLPSTYFIPGASMHAFLFFVPTILMGAGLRRYLMFITLGAGPLLSMWLSKADMSTYPLEWCVEGSGGWLAGGCWGGRGLVVELE